jgi:signal transduction histidine kinase
MDWGKAFAGLRERAGRYLGGLAGQMLALSIAVVIAADVLLLGPALGAFHDNWLWRRASAGQTAALAAEAGGATQVSSALEADLLDNAGIVAVTLYRTDERVLALAGAVPAEAAIRTVDLRDPSRRVAAMLGGIDALFAPRGRHVRVLINPGQGGGRLLDVLAAEDSLRDEIRRFAQRQFFETLVVSALVGGILYLALLALVVRRIGRLTAAIAAFGKRPRDVSSMPEPGARDDELSRAEHALAQMGEEVRVALRQRERLAALGEAVAKIAHDLRNSLAAAQLVSDRLSGSDDPKVRQSAPRLERAIARAAALAEAALKYGKADEPKPRLQELSVRTALDEAAGDALAGRAGIAWANEAAPVSVRADPDSLHRVFVNLMRNAGDVLAGQDGARIAAATLDLGEMIAIDIVDNGPGVSDRVRPALFQPFATTQRDGGGVGLGLSISRELCRAMGGDVTLQETSASGSRFRVLLPKSV